MANTEISFILRTGNLQFENTKFHVFQQIPHVFLICIIIFGQSASVSLCSGDPGKIIYLNVPGDEFDEVGGEGDAGLGVKDGAVGVSDEVGGHDLVLGVGEVALHWAIGSGLHGSLDLVV